MLLKLRNNLKYILVFVLLCVSLVFGLLIKDVKKSSILLLGDNKYLENYFDSSYFIKSNFSYNNMKSEDLLYYINNNVKSNDSYIVDEIKYCKVICLSIGLYDVLNLITYNNYENSISYDLDLVKLNLDIYEQNLYHIIDDIININENVSIILTTYDDAFSYLSKKDDLIKKVNNVIVSISNVFSLNLVRVNLNNLEYYDKDNLFKLNNLGKQKSAEIIIKKVVALI